MRFKQKLAYVLAILLAFVSMFGGVKYQSSYYNLNTVNAASPGEAEAEYNYILPTDLKWSKPGVISFKIQDTTHGYWRVIVQKDGENNYSFFNLENLGDRFGLGETYELNVSTAFRHGSGDYRFQVGIAKDYDTILYKGGNWTGFSAPYYYNADFNKLATPKNVKWSDLNQGFASWTNVEGVERYDLEFYIDGGVDIWYRTCSSSPMDLSNLTPDVNIHEYKFRVRSMSSDLNINSHSDWSELSEALHPIEASNTAAGIIEKAAAEGDKSVISKKYASDNDKEVLCRAINSNSDLQEQISILEKKYAEKNSITINKAKSTLSEIDESKVSVIGAALSAEEGSSIGISVGKAEANMTKYKTDLYNNVFTFEMKLIQENGDQKKEITELDVPVTITIPIPSGYDINTLRILHFLSDGSIDEIRPSIVDGKNAKFTISHFSTFAFAEASDGNSNVAPSTSSGSSKSNNQIFYNTSSNSRSSSSSNSSSSSSSSSSSGYSKGDIMTAGKGAGKADYKKISASSVRYEATNIGSKVTKALVPATVKIGGKTYKVTSVAPKAFAGKKNLKSLIIGKNVKKLGAKAFSGCKKLKTITINSSGLSKKNVKGSLKDSSVNTVKAPAKMIDNYKKIFTKTNAGRKASVKAK